MKYRYEFYQGIERDTVNDIEFPSDVLAIREGYRTAVELLEEGIILGVSRESWSIDIFDEKQQRVARILLSNVLTEH